MGKKKRKSRGSETAPSVENKGHEPVSAAVTEEGPQSHGASGTDSHRRVFRVFLLVFVTLMLSGYLMGRARSPNYNEADGARDLIEAYVTSHSSIEYPEWKPTQAASSHAVDLELQGGVIQFSCGFKIYRRDLRTGEEVSNADYDFRQKQFEPKPLPKKAHSDDNSNHDFLEEVDMPMGEQNDLYLKSHFADLPAREPEERFTPREGANLNEVIGIMIGGAEAFSLKHSASEVRAAWGEMKGVSRVRRLGKAVQLVGAGVSGYAFGFYLGYRNSPNCASPEFSNQLDQNLLWKSAGTDLMAANSIRFERSSANSPITTILTRSGNTVSLRDSWVIINSVLNTKPPGLDRRSFVISDSVRDTLKANTALQDPLEYLPMWFDIASLMTGSFFKKYQDSKLYWRLMRAATESALWDKYNKNSWIPTENPLVIANIDHYFGDVFPKEPPLGKQEVDILKLEGSVH